MNQVCCTLRQRSSQKFGGIIFSEMTIYLPFIWPIFESSCETLEDMDWSERCEALDMP